MSDRINYSPNPIEGSSNQPPIPDPVIPPTEHRGGYNPYDNYPSYGGGDQGGYHSQINMEFPTDPKMQNRIWEDRQRMAWLALVGIFVVTAMAFFVIDDQKLHTLLTGEIFTWLYFTLGAIVVAYFGFKSWSFKDGGGRY